MKNVPMIGGPLDGTIREEVLGKTLVTPYWVGDDMRYCTYELRWVRRSGKFPVRALVCVTPRANGQAEEAQHDHYDLFEDVITKLRFGDLDRKEQHDQLRRVLAAGAQPRSDVFEGSVSPG